MCECFGRADVQVEELPPRYYGGNPTKRISFIRDVERDYEDGYAYSRPRSSNTSMKQITYRPAKSNKHKEDRDNDKSQYKSPPKIDYPKESRFVPLPPLLHDDEIEEIREPQKGILRNGRKKHSSQPSLVVYSPKRGRKDRKYYYEDDDSDSWDDRSGRTDWSEASGDSWAIRPVKKYSDVKRKGRSRSRGRGRYH
jgi:hypothetical protein